MGVCSGSQSTLNSPYGWALTRLSHQGVNGTVNLTVRHSIRELAPSSKELPNGRMWKRGDRNRTSCLGEGSKGVSGTDQGGRGRKGAPFWKGCTDGPFLPLLIVFLSVHDKSNFNVWDGRGKE
ncbi:hypothetical protein CDAR_393351 [Caerostris darwini]|uniref:Uncharacterized protein n=1 Tax=Caerostris darwini TaxID=1538125 RepID=A0AAV4QAU0_9ARAC|nr:hypothetical protein CDAR_393351 [Caerostris darwini]